MSDKTANWPDAVVRGGDLTHVVEITPADTDLDTWVRVIYVDDEVEMKITTIGGEAVVMTLFRGYNPIGARRIWATGSTPGTAQILGWY